MSVVPFVLVPQYFGATVFERGTGRYVALDSSMSALLEHGSVIDAVGALPDAERRAAGARVRELWGRGWFDPNGRFQGQRLQAVPPEGHLLGPLVVHLELLAACNLACTHCSATPLPRKGRLTLLELDALFAELASLGSFRLHLAGGEVLMRPDLLEVLDLALGHGLSPRLTTNGLLLNEALARALGQRPGVQINVSLEGATAQSNDAVRGQGTFEQVLQRLATLHQHARFALAFTVTSDNHQELEQCAALAERLGARAAVFRPLYPVGAAQARPELMPEFEDYSGALSRLAGNGPVQLRLPTGCGAGSLQASISSEGEVSPCSFLGASYGSGNVRQRPFREIWDAGHRFLELRAVESRGCRARAISGQDPWQEAWEREPTASLPPLCGVELTCER